MCDSGAWLRDGSATASTLEWSVVEHVPSRKHTQVLQRVASDAR